MVTVHRNDHHPPLYVPLYILAGGYSRRMGFPKPLLPFPERPLLVVLAERLAAAFPRQWVICTHEALSPRFEKALSDYGLLDAILLDDRPAAGPLAGIERAARHALHLGAARWLVIPCDLPFLTPAFLARLVTADLAAPAVVPCSPTGNITGVCAAYGPAIQPTLTDLLNRGQRRVQDFLTRVGAAQLTFPRYADLPYADQLLVNLNTPDDYRQALAIICANRASKSVSTMSSARQSGVKKPSATARSRNDSKPS